MKSKILSAMFIFVLLILLFVISSCPQSEYLSETYDWNNGHCIECGGELKYSGTGSKEHYTCEECGKEVTFDKVMNKKSKD